MFSWEPIYFTVVFMFNLETNFLALCWLIFLYALSITAHCLFVGFLSCPLLRSYCCTCATFLDYNRACLCSLFHPGKSRWSQRPAIVFYSCPSYRPTSVPSLTTQPRAPDNPLTPAGATEGPRVQGKQPTNHRPAHIGQSERAGRRPIGAGVGCLPGVGWIRWVSEPLARGLA